jgi:hypothetical protein
MTALHEKSTLVSLEGSTWRGVKSDREATDGTATLFDTTVNWVFTSKRLVDPVVLREPKRVLGQARNYLRGQSVGPVDGKSIPGGLPPWDSKGWYILPNVLNEQVTRNLGQFASDFTDAVDKLRAVLPTAIDAARAENPKLFKDSDYGSVDEVIEKYTFALDRTLVPDAGDVRVDASKEFVDHLKGQIEAKSTKKLNDVTSHVVRTVVDVATHLANALEGYDPEKKGASPFRDSTVQKVRDLIGVIPALNVTGDAKVDKARQDLLAAIGNKSAKELREDDDDRKSVAAKARTVAANISNLFD